MKKTTTILLLLIVACVTSFAQRTLNRQGANKEGGKKQEKAFIMPGVKAWKMTDLYTLADTIPVDTLTNEHQINNPIWRNNVANVTLGNLGSPTISAFYPTIKRVEGNIFYNSIAEYIDYPDDFVFFNTKTPYTNLTYQMGYPKRRSEEYVHVLFTQNVNRRVNVGFKFKLSSSIGRYESQRADHASFRLFASYDGDNYKCYGTGVYHSADIKENGGILNDNYIMYPDSFEYDKPEDIPVQFMDARNYTSTYQLHFAHSLVLAHAERMDTDSNFYEVPALTAYHQLHIDKSHHEFRIGNLGNYSAVADKLFPDIINDNRQTADSMRYFMVSNLFQIKMNEEFNSLLRFGVRAYIGNDIRRYHWPAQSDIYTNDNNTLVINYRTNEETQVTSFVGGQIFKNIGENLRWNAGVKLYFQGYRTGDFSATGNISSAFNLLGNKAAVYAKGNLDLRSPELFEDKYTSNHYQWSQSLDRTKTLNINGGIRIDALNLDLSGFAATIDNRIYFNAEGVPTQKDGVLQIFGAYLYKHFQGAGFNSINRVTLQSTSDEEVLALPLFAIYNTNFWEHKFFGVLTLQLGFDFKYNSRYFAPKYIPATMQFCTQSERKTGGYPYFDPFVNIQLKRARAYLKYEHVNSMWGSQDYFSTIHYPANPNTIKFGISWNFYD